MLKKVKKMEKFDLISNIIVFILAIFFILPLLWLITNSFKTSTDIYKMPPDILPKNFYLGNFTELFQNQPAFRWAFNSFLVSIGTTVLSVVISACAAYAFAKLRFRGKNIIFALFVGSMTG